MTAQPTGSSFKDATRLRNSSDNLETSGGDAGPDSDGYMGLPLDENLPSDAFLFPFDGDLTAQGLDSGINHTDSVVAGGNNVILPWITNELQPTQLDHIPTGSNNSPSASPYTIPKNAGRGLPRRRSRYLMNPAHGTSPVFISPSETPLHPLDRWEASPPEAEGASLSAIRNALENPSIETSGNDAGSGHDLFQRYRRPASRAASTTSAESGSVASSRRSDRSGVSSGSQGRVRKKQTGPKKRRSAATNPRIFCCTFCCDKFKSKFDWMRHEKSLHLNLENWICAPFGGSVVLESTGRAHCAYCNQLDPTMDHLNQHNHAPCHEQTRKFRRKDHLVQHLRLFHRLDTLPLIDNWKQATTNFSSRCGFCDSHLSSWDERADHLAVHFRNGCTMAHWKGDHNFPPEIAANITHSVPPYMLDFESRSFVPFSATNRDASDHLSQMLSRATYLDRPDTDTQNNHGHRPVETQTPDVPWPEHAHEHAHEHEHEHGNQFAPQSPQVDSYTEVLTRHLSHYAQRMMRSGIIPTDEMFQTEARRLLFDSEDTWDQTLADNIHWLGQFRQETCSAVHKPANPSASGPHEPSQ